jgi:hypothetical protein
MKRVNVFLGLVMGVVMLALLFAGGGRLMAETAVIQNAPPGWTEPKPISGNIGNAKRPTLQADPSQPGRLMAIFISHQTEGEVRALNPYVTISTNYGQSWSAPAPIRQSAQESKQIRFVFDNQGVAHAVWREGDTLTTLAYANSSNWSTTYRNLTTAVNPGVNSPSVTTFGDNIHVAWSAANINSADPIEQELNIYYLRSSNRGASWQATPTALTIEGTAQAPNIVADPSGNLHLVWQQRNPIFDPGTGEPISFNFEVYYRKGSVTGGSVVWSPRISLSSLVNPGIEFNAQEPRLLFSEGILKMAFTVIIEPEVGYREQYIYLTTCASNCQQIESWTNLDNISGPEMFVNIEPVNLAASLTQQGDCTYIFFDGATEDNLEQNEQIWQQNGCIGWNAPRMAITEVITRALRPSADTLNEWTYLVYEDVNRQEVGSSFVNNNKIYFLAQQNASGITNLTIQGATSGFTNLNHSFTAVVAPSNVTGPLEFNWIPEPQSGQQTSQATYRWTKSGQQTVRVTVTNPTGSKEAAHTITLYDEASSPKLYLPLIRK